MAGKVKFKHNWRRRLFIAAGVFAVLLTALYFALTSTTFVRRFLIPRVAQILGAEITVADTAISPFSSAELHGLQVQVAGREPLLEAERVQARYSLLAMLVGRIEVSEVTVVNPKINVVETADGKNNLPVLFNKPAPKKKFHPKTPARVDLTPKVRIENVTIQGAELCRTRIEKSGARQMTQLSDVNVKVNKLENGQSGKLSLSSSVRIEQGPANAATNDVLTAKAGADFDFALTRDLEPASLKGLSKFEVLTAAGNLSDLAGLSATVDCDFATNRLNRLMLGFAQRNKKLGEIKASGAFNPARSEGDVELVVSSIDRQVLNLIGAKRGIDFQKTALNGSSRFDFSRGGQIVSGAGKFQGRNFSAKQASGTTPAVDLDLSYEFKADLVAERLTLQALKLSARQGQTEVIRGGLDYPMEVSWSKTTASSFTKSTLTLNLRQLDLSEWRALHGRTNLVGKISAEAAVTATPGNQRLELSLNSALGGFAFGTMRQSQLQAKFHGAYSVKDDAHVFTGKASLANTEGVTTDVLPLGYQSDLEFDVATKPDEIDVRRALLKFSGKGAGGGTVEITGQFGSSGKRGKASLKLNNLNQHALGPLLTPVLAPKRVELAKLDGSASVKLSATNQSAIDANLSLANLVIIGTNGSKSSPLGAGLKLSATSAGDVHELKELLLTLAPTDRAQNELRVVGKVDLRHESPSPSTLTANAESLDVTPLWDAFAPAKSSTPAATATSSTPAPEPDPVKLPVKQFNAEVNIGRLYARNIAVSNFVTTVRLNDGLLAIKPCEFSLNGAPVKALLDMNLGVKGFLYDLNLTLDHLPLQPIMDSVSPDKPGSFRGELSLTSTVKGTGITEESLSRNLKGDLGVTLTNAAIEIAHGWKQGVFTVVGTLLGVPELTRDPIAWANGAARIDGGRVDLPDARIGSEAFIAGVTGTIQLAPVLTNSALDLPVKLELRRTLIQKAKLVLGGQSDSKFAVVPDFLKVKGTLGKPKADIRDTALAGVLPRLIGAVPNLLGEKAGAVVQGIGGLLTGSRPSGTNANTNAGTNLPTTNSPPRPNLLDLFKPKN